MAGAEQVSDALLAQGVNRVLLLSDGLANAGVTRPAQIYADIRRWHERGIAVTTLGLGLDYNEDLMQTIAEHGHGRYYFIENPQQLTRLFQQELSSLAQTVASGVSACFRATMAVSDVKVYGYPAVDSGACTRIELEEFYAGEERSLLLQLQLSPQQVGTVALGELQFSYRDKLRGAEVNQNLPWSVTVVESSQQADEALQHATLSEAILIAAEAEQSQFLRQFEQGEQEQALNNLRQLAQQLAQQNRSLKSEALARKIEALNIDSQQMVDIQTAPAAEAKSYIKTQKQRFYQAQKGRQGGYLLQRGANGFQVERLQQRLKALGHYQGEIDGLYEEEVEAAVRRYQRQHTLGVDGVAGPNTLQHLGLY